MCVSDVFWQRQTKDEADWCNYLPQPRQMWHKLSVRHWSCTHLGLCTSRWHTFCTPIHTHLHLFTLVTTQHANAASRGCGHVHESQPELWPHRESRHHPGLILNDPWRKLSEDSHSCSQSYWLWLITWKDSYASLRMNCPSVVFRIKGGDI